MSALLMAFAAVQLTQNAQYDARYSAGFQTQQQRYSLNSIAEKRAEQTFFTVSRRGQPTVQDAEQLLNQGQAFPRIQEGSEMRLLYTDPTTGGRALLMFNDDVWNSVTPYSNDPLITSAVPNPNAGLYGTLHLGRQIAYMIGYLWWFMLYCIIIFERLRRPWSRPYARCIDLLAIALVSTTLALLGPNPRRAIYDYFQDDSAGWGIFAILMSVFVFLVIHFKRVSNPSDATPRCRTCDYDLTGNQSGICPECGTSLSRIMV